MPVSAKAHGNPNPETEVGSGNPAYPHPFNGTDRGGVMMQQSRGLASRKYVGKKRSFHVCAAAGRGLADAKAEWATRAPIRCAVSAMRR